MDLTPAIAIHLSAALGAVATGPIALWARRAGAPRPRLHRAFGYAWVTLMVVTAVSALFIRDRTLPNIGGYTPIHLLVPLTLSSLYRAFAALARGDIARHRKQMKALYISACLVAGAFTLLPGRLLGSLFWNSMPVKIVAGTPLWVWALLAALVALGYSQTRDRRAGVARVAAMPLAMTAFSLWGMTSSFAGSALLPLVLAAWGAAAGVAFALTASRPAPATYDAVTRTFALPGSWLPMALILGIFFVRYVANVALALQPTLSHDTVFAIGLAGASGGFSGLFIARAARLLRLVVAARGTPLALQS